MKTEKDLMMETTPIWALLRRMSLPSIVGVMAYNAYNLFDTLLISQGAGTNALGGVAVSFPLFLLLSALSSTLGNGAASVMSRALGEKEIEKATKTAANTFLLFYTAAIVVTVFGLIFLDPLLYAIGVTDNLLPYARSYTRIILLGAVTSTGFSNLIRAEGDSRYAMLIWVIPISANIVLDLVFIFVLHMGVVGAALGTVLAQCISMFMSFYFFFWSGKSMLKFYPRHFRPDLHLCGEMLLLGIPSFLQLSGMSISIMVVNQFLRNYGGDLPISTYGIVNKVITFFLFPIMGLMQGMQPIIGYNKGAGKYKRVRETVRKGSLLAGVYGLIGYLILYVFAEGILKIFTSNPAVITLGTAVLRIVGASLCFSGIQNVLIGYCQAMGQTRYSMLLVLLSQVICFVPAIMLLNRVYGQVGIWYAFPVSAGVCVVISGVLIRQATVPC